MTVPQREGLYWARWEKAANQEFNLIARVRGTAPFMQVTMIGVDDGSVDHVLTLSRYGNIVWGPEIIRPEVSKDGS